MSDLGQKLEQPQPVPTNQQARAKLFQIRVMWGAKCGERGTVPDVVWTKRYIDAPAADIKWVRVDSGGRGEEALFERVE